MPGSQSESELHLFGPTPQPCLYEHYSTLVNNLFCTCLLSQFLQCCSVFLRRMVTPDERIEYWKDRWQERQIGFHKTDIHPVMSKHLDKLIPDGKTTKVFFPLCGKSVDMKWLADKGFTVVGVDGVSSALEEFFRDNGLECIVEDVPNAGENAKVYKSSDGNIRLYCCDIMSFTSDLEGTIDAVWDRGSLEALKRKDVPGYINVIKKLLSPRSRILLEVAEYDIAVMADLAGPTKPPPPYAMEEEEIERLYEPECTVQFVDRCQGTAAGKDVNLAYYLIIKKS